MSARAHKASSSASTTAPRKVTRWVTPSSSATARKDWAWGESIPGPAMSRVQSRSNRRARARISRSCPLRGMKAPRERMVQPGPPDPAQRGAGAVPGAPKRGAGAPPGAALPNRGAAPPGGAAPNRPAPAGTGADPNRPPEVVGAGVGREWERAGVGRVQRRMVGAGCPRPPVAPPARPPANQCPQPPPLTCTSLSQHVPELVHQGGRMAAVVARAVGPQLGLGGGRLGSHPAEGAGWGWGIRVGVGLGVWG